MRWWRNERVQAFVLGVATSVVATEVLNAVGLAVEQLKGVPPWLIGVVGVVLIGVVLTIAVPGSRRWVARAWGKWLGALTVFAVIAAALGALLTAAAGWSADQAAQTYLWHVRHGNAAASFSTTSDGRYLAEGRRVCTDISRGLTEAQYDTRGTSEVPEPGPVRDAIWISALHNLCPTAATEPTIAPDN